MVPRSARDVSSDAAGGAPMDDRTLSTFLLAIVARDWDRAAALAPPGGPPAERFVALCRDCDVLPTVHDALVRADRGSLVGAEALAGLAAGRRKVRHDNLLLFARAEQAADALLAAGVTPVALKGLDFLTRLYPAFDARTIDDIDVLVAREELEATVAALVAAGYTTEDEAAHLHYIRSSHHVPLFSPEPFPVLFEVHWNIVQDVRFSVDAAGLVARSQPLDLGGRAIRRLADHDAAAHLVVHHFTHYFDRRLKWLVDLERLAAQPGFSWDAVVARIREWGAATTGGIVLRHLRKLAPGLIPDAALAALPVAAWRLALASWLRSSHPLELYRNTRSRNVQLYLAAVMMERPTRLPGWLLRRRTRDRRPGGNPLEPGA